MKVQQITVGGFTNIDTVCLSLSNLCALLAYNNYGKSNVLSAIIFGLDYMKATAEERENKMMTCSGCIPINKTTAGKDFLFKIDVEVGCGGRKSLLSYEYRFAWPQQQKAPHITYESLKVKNDGETKTKAYIKREGDNCLYLSSATGRCSTHLKVDESQLGLSKLSNYDNLFYVDLLKELLNFRIVETDSLADPKSFFRTINVSRGRTAFSSGINSIPDFASSAYYMYTLKDSDPCKYSLFRDAVSQLIPSIEDFEPIKIDFKTQVARFDGDTNVPYQLPDFVYDIVVKEKNLNQQVTIGRLSSGTKRIFYLLLMIVAAEINKVPLILIEEIENSIHPSLFQRLLSTIKTLAGECQIILTSHSPYLLQYLKPELMYVGIPNIYDVAVFKKIKTSKIKTIIREASMSDMSVGDYLFDLLQDINSPTDGIATKYFE